MRGLILRITVAVTSVGMIVANLLANALPFFGRATGEISAMFPTLVTPAGYVFAIWGLIYIGMIAISIVQFIEPLRTDPLPEAIATPIIIANFANVGWLLLWHSLNIGWSVLVMFVLLGSLIAAYVLARRGRPGKRPGLERWGIRAPLSLYLGWVSVATIANISGALVAADWNGFGFPPEVWATIVLLVGLALALTVLLRETDGVYPLVFVWAYGGIVAASASATVRGMALVLSLIIAVAAVWVVAKRRQAV